MIQDSGKTDPFVWEPWTQSEIALLKAYREFILAERNKVDEYIARLREERLIEEAFNKRQKDLGLPSVELPL